MIQKDIQQTLLTAQLTPSSAYQTKNKQLQPVLDAPLGKQIAAFKFTRTGRPCSFDTDVFKSFIKRGVWYSL